MNSNKLRTPPKLAKWILSVLLPGYLYKSVLDDYEEIFQDIAEKKGSQEAKRWYWKQTIKTVPVHTKESVYWSAVMYKNYLKIAIRNLLRHKSYTFINVSGLAVGIASFLLIALYIQYEMSYDKFHEQAKNIYRVTLNRITPDAERHSAFVPMPLANAVASDYPEVLRATRLSTSPSFSGMRAQYRNKSYSEKRLFFADANFFDVFTVSFIKGDSKTALAKPNTIVITKTTALKYFGNEEPMGKIMTLASYGDYTITGITDEMPPNSHFHFDLLASYISLDRSRSTSWTVWGDLTYLVLAPNTSPDALEAKFPEMVNKYVGTTVTSTTKKSMDEYRQTGNDYRYSLQKLTDIHLTSHLTFEAEPNGDIKYIYMLSVTGVLILIIACINFMNLSTAKAVNRAKEVGVRKVLGSQQVQLIKQFMLDANILSFLAMAIAVLLVEAVTPAFNNFTGKPLDLHYFSNPWVIPGLLGLFLGVGVLSGSYPAFFLSSFQPIETLKNRSGSGSQNSVFRNTLVVFQFAVSIMLIIGTSVVYQQLTFMQNKKLGFDKDKVIVLEGTGVIGDKAESLRQELMANPAIENAAYSMRMIGGRIPGSNVSVEGRDANIKISALWLPVGFNFAETMGIKVLQGRDFLREFTGDVQPVIINKQLVNDFGLEDPVGKSITWNNAGKRTIVGVMDDFHYESLHTPVGPFMLVLNDSKARLSVRFNSHDIPGIVNFIKSKWAEFAPGEPFNYSFLGEDLEVLYKAEQQTGELFGLFSLLAVFIACLGLFGLSAFTAEQRTKEIGIRKVLGESVTGVILMLTREYTKLISIAAIISFPISYYLMLDWLSGFAYRADISLIVFGLTGLATLFIALLTVSYQSYKSAQMNPVEALKND